MTITPAHLEPRHFLFLQGPHGPFYRQLARRLIAAGHRVSRVAFNAGDAVFWRGLPGRVDFHRPQDDWPGWVADLMADTRVTDLVCYGASRPIHQSARDIAAKHGIRQHTLEEGYLRPYWATYERGGTNAASPLMGIPITEMRAALEERAAPLSRAPDRWGDMRSHVFWGAAYHMALLAGQARFPGFSPHRNPSPRGELPIYARHVATLPVRRIRRHIATARVLFGAFSYHVALLQLAHDANFRDNGPFPTQRAFLDAVCAGFAAGAPAHHHLVLKAHPLEDGREPLAPIIQDLTRRFGLEGRVHLVTGGKLARLLDYAESVITVNSTAAEQALWRGLPVRALGRAVYDRPELTSRQPIASFFASPDRCDPEAYAMYRRYLLATSQIAGGFYSARGRRRLLRRLPDLMLAEKSPYEALNAAAAPVQHLAAVRL